MLDCADLVYCRRPQSDDLLKLLDAVVGDEEGDADREGDDKDPRPNSLFVDELIVLLA